MEKFKGVHLNSILISKNNVSKSNQDIIMRLHEIKHYLFQFMESTDDVVKLKKYAKLVEDVEYKLQYHWGFNVDNKYHDWFRVPKCSCPRMDNQDVKGTGIRYTDSNCVIHG